MPIQTSQTPSKVLSPTEPIELLVEHHVNRVIYQSSKHMIFESPTEEITSEVMEILKDYAPYATCIADAWYVTVPLAKATPTLFSPSTSPN